MSRIVVASKPLVRISVSAACSMRERVASASRFFFGRVGAFVVSVVLGFLVTRAAMIEDPHGDVHARVASTRVEHVDTATCRCASEMHEAPLPTSRPS
jgi:hypothetical protein